MIGAQGTTLANRVLHFGSSLRGTYQYWMRQRSRLTAMIDTLGIPTIFITHSAADMQCPELANLICAKPDDRKSRSDAVIANPAIADCFFYERIKQFMKHFYVGILNVLDYWIRFEWQHRGSPHVHGLAWLKDAPDVGKLHDPATTQHERNNILHYIDSLVSTMNPALAAQDTDFRQAPAAQKIHISVTIPTLKQDRIYQRIFHNSSQLVRDIPYARRLTAYEL